jgi:GTPase
MPDSETSRKFVSGFVSIVGRPNSGKSTLLNAFIGQKLAIVADKPQTTRTYIQGVLTLPDAQVIFVDTPGIHRSDNTFNKRMMETVRTALADRDLILYVADATYRFTDADAQALDAVKKSGAPTFLLLNKIDRLKSKEALLPLIEKYRSAMEFEEVFFISALKGEGIDQVRETVLRRMPEGPRYFPEDQVTDQPERFLAAELIREKILQATEQEVPHSVAVLVDKWEVKPKLVRIAATIFVEKEGQKRIIIGTKGSVLKEVGTQARQEIEALLDRKVFLELFVKVRSNWRENPEFLNVIDWRSMAGTEE